MSNVVQSIDWANVTLNDNVIATEIWEPMFHWYWELINVAIIFFPICFIVSMFWFIYSWGKSLINRTDVMTKKDLYNK